MALSRFILYNMQKERQNVDGFEFESQFYVMHSLDMLL